MPDGFAIPGGRPYVSGWEILTKPSPVGETASCHLKPSDFSLFWNSTALVGTGEQVSAIQAYLAGLSCVKKSEAYLPVGVKDLTPGVR